MYITSSRRGRERKMKKYGETVGTAGWYKIRTLTRNIPIVPCGNPEYRYINISTPSTWASSTITFTTEEHIIIWMLNTAVTPSLNRNNAKAHDAVESLLQVLFSSVVLLFHKSPPIRWVGGRCWSWYFIRFLSLPYFPTLISANSSFWYNITGAIAIVIRTRDGPKKHVFSIHLRSTYIFCSPDWSMLRRENRK